jgi:hypothetical protein
MIPRVVWEQPISGVYEQDHSVTGPGVRMLAIEPYVFVRVKPKSGGWRAFDLTTHS